MDLQVALDAVYSAITTVNAIRSDDDMIPLRPDVVLAGEDGCLDSLALVTLVLAIERQVVELTGHEVSLLDESDFESRLFRTPTAIANLVVEKTAT